jgi:hypothetical protein
MADYLPFLRAGLLMFLGAYFDESERDDAQEPICVAGYVFKPSGYEKFRKRWRYATRIGAKRYEPFHMTDLVGGHGIYKGLSIPERVGLLDHAVDAVTSHAYCGIGTYFDRAEFEAVAPPEWPIVFGSIYGAACQMSVALTAHHLTTQKRCHLRVLYTFERGHKYEDEVDRVLKSIRDNPDQCRNYLYKNHVFEEKGEYGLQAADLLAWTTTKLESGAWQARSFGAFLPSILRLGGKDESQVRYIKITGEGLHRYLREAITLAQSASMTVDLGRHKRAFR